MYTTNLFLLDCVESVKFVLFTFDCDLTPSDTLFSNMDKTSCARKQPGCQSWVLTLIHWVILGSEARHGEDYSTALTFPLLNFSNGLSFLVFDQWQCIIWDITIKILSWAVYSTVTGQTGWMCTATLLSTGWKAFKNLVPVLYEWSL